MADDLMTRNFFLINIHGQIESCTFPGRNYENLYCKCLLRYGPDWALVNTKSKNNNDTNDGDEKCKDKVFLSQIANKRPDDILPMFVWNLPIDFTFKSSNVFGWPQIVGMIYFIQF